MFFEFIESNYNFQFDKVYQLDHFNIRKQLKHLAFKDIDLQVVLESNSNISEVINDDVPNFLYTFNNIDMIQLLAKDSQCGIYYFLSCLNCFI